MNPLLLALAFMTGLTLFFVVPVFLGGFLPQRGRQYIGDVYTKMAMTAIDRGTVVIRDHGGLDLVPMRFDVDKEAEEVTLDGETEHITDDFNVIGWLYNRQFGIADESASVFTDCLWSEIGSLVAKHRTEGRLTRQVKVKTDGGDGEERVELRTQMSDILPLDTESRLIWPGSVRKTVGGNRRPTDGETAYEQGEKSQEGFHRSVSIGQATAIGIAFGLGGVLVWFIANYGNAATNVDSTTIPVFLAGVGL